MIADLRPYPDYRESGPQPLGQVPLHWNVCQVRRIGRLLKGSGGTKEDAVSKGIPCVRYGELYTTHTNFIRACRTFIKPDRVGGYTPLEYGDVLFAASGETIEEIGKSAVNLMRTPAVCGGDVIILRPTVPVHAPFLGYAMDCRPATNQKAAMARGTTVQHIYPDELRGLIVAIPPLDEQAAIARFLDWASRRLGRAIRAKRKVLALLDEQKQAIINRAVTRGLNPSVTLKPSGIPWLGDIPQHWEVRKLKYQVSFRGGGTPSKGNPVYWNGAIPWVSPKDMKSEVIRDAQDHITQRAVAESSTSLVPAGSLLMVVRSGILRRTIPVALCSREVAINQDMKALTGTGQLAMDYFVSLIHGCEKLLLQIWTKQGATVESIEHQYLANTKVPIPPREEQQQIVSRIASETTPQTSAISRLEREIDYLLEYRTRLVADVVTGKLDVRDAAARLPEDAPPDIAEGEIGIDLSDDADADDEEAAA